VGRSTASQVPLWLSGQEQYKRIERYRLFSNCTPSYIAGSFTGKNRFDDACLQRSVIDYTITNQITNGSLKSELCCGASCLLRWMRARVSVKPGLWTGLDYGLDWTVDWTGLTKQLYTDSERCQGYNSLSPALPQVAFLLLSPRGIVFSISERSKVTCIFNKLPQRWLWTTWTTPCGFCKG